MKKATAAQKRAIAHARAAKRAKKDAKDARKARAAHAREAKAKQARERSSQPRPGSIVQKRRDGDMLLHEHAKATEKKDKARYRSLWQQNTEDLLHTPHDAPPVEE